MHTLTRSRFASGAVLLGLIVLATDAPAQPVVAPPPRLKPEAGPPLPAGAVARIGQPRLKFPGAAINVAFAPSGTTFVSTSNPAPGGKDTNRLVVLWDAATGKEIRQFRGHLAGVEALAFSKDGKQIVTSGQDTSVRLWDVASGEEIRRFTGHTAQVLAVACSPDQKLIASSGHDNTIRVWDAGTAKEIRRFPGRRSQGTSNLQFSPDGKLLAVVSPDSAIRLWNPTTGEFVAKLVGPTAPAGAAGPVGDTLSIDFSHDGKRLAAISADGNLWMWEVATEKELLKVPAHKGVGACVRFSPDDSILATGGSDGSIRFWDGAGKLLRSAAGHPANNVSEISFSADGSMLASAGHEGTVRLWDVASALELPQSGGTATRIALSPDGKRLATAGGDPIVRFWEPATGKELLPALRIDRPARALGFSPDSRSVITSNSVDELRVWDIESGKEIRQIGTQTIVPVSRLAVGSGGRYLATSGSGVPLRLWDTATGKLADNSAVLAAGVRPFPPTRAMAFARNDTRLALGCGDGRVHVWDVTNGRELYAVPGAGPMPGVSALAWSPDGRTFASVGAVDGSLRLWEAVSGQERLTRVLLPAAGWSVAFSPDGRLLAVGSLGGFLRLYNVQTGKELASRTVHQAAVASLAFTPDGHFLITAGTDIHIPMQNTPDTLVIGDGTALVWDVAALVKEIPAAPKPTPAETEALWTALGGGDPRKAGDAVWQLAAAPEVSLPFLKERLAKVAPGDTDKRVEKLLAELDDDDFDVREKATQELIRIGSSGIQAVRNTLAVTKSREVRRRAEEVIAKVGPGQATSAEEILVVRGTEVLQRINTAESRRILEVWSEGPAGALLTREARAALAQMGKSP